LGDDWKFVVQEEEKALYYWLLSLNKDDVTIGSSLLKKSVVKFLLTNKNNVLFKGML